MPHGKCSVSKKIFFLPQLETGLCKQRRPGFLRVTFSRGIVGCGCEEHIETTQISLFTTVPELHSYNDSMNT